ncbi:hypothetical protein T439DRAFT_325008 [Meredithblackwellia eburnea MCA 4105]
MLHLPLRSASPALPSIVQFVRLFSTTLPSRTGPVLAPLAPAPRTEYTKETNSSEQPSSAIDWASRIAAESTEKKRLHNEPRTTSSSRSIQPHANINTIMSETSSNRRRLSPRSRLQPPSLPASKWMSRSLPTTEMELHHLFWTLRRASVTSSDALSLFEFHSRPEFAGIVSSRTYGHLLALAHARSNKALALAVLEEMLERKVPWNDRVCRIVTSLYQKRGEGEKVEEVAAMMRKVGWEAPFVADNGRRDLGEASKGRGDPYRNWLRRESLVDGGKVEKPRAKKGEKERKDWFSSSLANGQVRPWRTPTIIPRNYATLPNEDITALVESLYQDRDGPRALDLARAWLDANRPAAPPLVARAAVSSPISHRPPPQTHPLLALVPELTRRLPLPPPLPIQHPKPPIIPQALLHEINAYNRTALVLLNILLKFLVVYRLPLSMAKSLLTEFISTHSVSSEFPIVPNEVTMIEFLPIAADQKGRNKGVNLSSPGAWARAVRCVNWIGVEFGVFDNNYKDDKRTEMISKEEKRRQLARGLRYLLAPGSHFAWLPVSRVPPSLARRLLRLAISEGERRRARLAAQGGKVRRVEMEMDLRRNEEFVRGWWRALSGTMRGFEWVAKFPVYEVGKARKLGLLLEDDEEERKKK